MQVKNISARGWFVFGKTIAPGKQEEVECTEADLVGNAELEAVIVKPKEEDQGMTKAEIVAALKEKGVEFDVTAKKADLQTLLDAQVA